MTPSEPSARTVAFYLEAAERPNTQRSYDAAIQHFEVVWGGTLPATPEGVARYLAGCAGTLAVNTLKHRLAALARWHADHGFVDPTRAPYVRRVLKGIQAHHGTAEKRATPLQLVQLGQVADFLERGANSAQEENIRGHALRSLRDRALILLGFWRGFRGDDLVSLQIEHLRFFPQQGMSCFLSQTKGDRNNAGRTYKVPMLSRWCAVSAVERWLEASGLSTGPLFRGINRWGQLSGSAIHPNSVIPMLRTVFTDAGLDTPNAYSGHSLRRGFAGWASANGWDVKTLMEYVGWKDAQSAMRYIDAPDPFAQQRIEHTLPKLLSDANV